jgi:N-acetylglutamate synthase-like GNAT family acetyltransferase
VDPANLQIRRANVDDLPSLKGLWSVARLPVLDLEKHLTEFQILTRQDGVILGAVAMRMAGGQGLLHSEAFYTPEHQDSYRPQLWERLQVLARNHGLTRVWTQEQSPFWHQAGFVPATATELKKFPPAFGDPRHPWTTLQLREEQLLNATLEREFELFQTSQREGAERMMRQAKTLKWIAALIAIGFFIAAFILLFTVFRRSVPGPRF